MQRGFAKRFESEVLGTVKRYSLAKKSGRVLVACSGGKDSTSVLHILNSQGYGAEALHIDLGIGEWSKANRANIASFCRDRGIRLHLASTRDYFGSSVCHIKSSVQERASLTSCSVCGVIKKWILNRKARELEADVLATGHNLDDEARTFMMNLINGNPELAVCSAPARISPGNLFVPRIKPLYFTLAKDVRRYSEEMKFPVLYERCPCSQGSFGRDIYDEITKLEETHPGTKMNLVKTMLALRSKFAKAGPGPGQVLPCRFCGEPSRNGVCRTCGMLSVLKMGKNANQVVFAH